MSQSEWELERADYYENCQDEPFEDEEARWLFEAALNAEAADYRQAEARQAAEVFPVTTDDELPW
jgi:hypothetical protein